MIEFVFANPRQWWKKLGNFILRRGDGCVGGHFAIIFNGFVYESVSPYSKKTPLVEWLKHYKIAERYEKDIPVSKYTSVAKFLQSYIGIRYAIDQIFFIGFCKLIFLDKIFNNKVLNGNKALVCTEYGSRFFEAFFTIEMKESHDKIGLHDMQEMCDRLDKLAWRE